MPDLYLIKPVMKWSCDSCLALTASQALSYNVAVLFVFFQQN